MERIRSRWWITLLLALLVVAVLLGCVGVVWCHGYSQRAELRHTAERLGYDPALEIAQVNRCWDIFAHCGSFLYYKTSATQAELAR